MTKRKKILLIGLLVLFVVLTIFQTTNPYRPYSSYSPMADGTKAISLLLNETGLTSHQLLDVVPDASGLMIVIEPEETVLEQDWEEIVDWVQLGNTLFLAGQQPFDLYQQLGFESELFFHEPKAHHVSSGHALLSEVESLILTTGARLQQHDAMNFAYGDDQGIFLAEIAMGQGQIITLTQPNLLTNRYIGSGDNVVLFLNIVRTYGEENVWFNEFAHGFTWTEDVRDVLIWPLRFVLIQLALGLLLLYYYWGKRFGRPIPLQEDVAQDTNEYINSLANIYRQGRAKHLTFENIQHTFITDLTKYLGVRSSISTDELIRIFSERPWIDAKELQELLKQCELLRTKPIIQEAELFTLVRDLDRWQEKYLLRRPERRIIHGSKPD